MRRLLLGTFLLPILGGCSGPPLSQAPPTPAKAPANLGQLAAAWQYPGAANVSGGSAAGLHSSVSKSKDPYTRIWAYYAKRVGVAEKYRPDALQVGSECTAGPCTAHAVTSANSPGMRSVTFAFRGSEVGVTATVRHADSAADTEIQLTVIAL